LKFKSDGATKEGKGFLHNLDLQLKNRRAEEKDIEEDDAVQKKVCEYFIHFFIYF